MSESSRTVLVVEDQAINRKIVCKMLKDRYTLFEAVNGLEALNIVKTNDNIGVILLDLVMPVMNGFEFLKKLKEIGKGAIPVVVMTGNEDNETEKKALQAGAIDFVTKPIDRQILLSRTENAMIRNQMVLLERMEFIANHDHLTKLYNRNKMFIETRKMLNTYKDIQFAMVRFDIDKFRMYNSAMGEDEGDRLLCFIADFIRQMAKEYDPCTYGRIDGDVFCMCQPYDKEMIMRHVDIAQKEITSYRPDYALDTSFGIYVIDDPSLSLETIFTRASMAADRCKDLYAEHCGFYDASMSQAVSAEQEITNEMRHALEEEQFVVYLQPKYDLDTERPCGAEALVRWVHPQKGLVSPGVFIPVFEKNGFISTLDYYMWEHVCALLHRWITQEKQVYPISVNMSRVSLFNPHVDELIIDLVQKYDVPPELLNLEVTESAYMANPEVLSGTIERLRKAGFIILMDDFGSGYSSLNTLKEIDIDILKLDMNFMPDGNDNGKSEKIISAVVRMAGWLNMDLIAEGVETIDQKNFLASIGCGYAQGYYYAKPMPVEEYETLIEDSIPVVHKASKTKEEQNDDHVIWSSDTQIAELLSSIDEPVAFFEYSDTHVELVRANPAFASIYKNEGSERQDGGLNKKENWNMRRLLHHTAETGEPVVHEFNFITGDGQPHWVRMKARKAAESPQAVIICCIFEEITQEKNFMKRFEKMINQVENHPIKKKILVIDDVEISRLLLQSMFTPEYDVIEAKDGHEGLKLLKENITDISAILLDLIMPQMDGEEFLKEKNALPGAENIPIVVISAESDTAVQLGMLKNGVCDYIVKPFDKNLTQQRVKNAMAYQSRFKNLLNEYKQLSKEE